MTPQARRAPALPVVLEVLPWVPISEESPLPRSSSSSRSELDAVRSS